MLLINHSGTDPYFNMALEEYLFFSKSEEICVLWQNAPAIIVGKHQNTMAEIDYEYTVREHIPVVRRMSGGGCVFHDLGNLNFTYIINKDEFGDYDGFTKSLRNFMASLGLKAELSGRNDLLIDGKKFSGNAQYFHKGRLLHHGTILLGADMTHLSRALKPDKNKIISKGIKSVKSRVANLNDYIDITVAEFKEGFQNTIISETGAKLYCLTPEENKIIDSLADSKYRTYEWNFGYSPKYTFRKKTFLPFGSIEVLLDISDGIINDAFIFGDFFAKQDTDSLAKLLCGIRHEADALSDILSNIDTDSYINGLTREDFLSCLI